MELVKVTEIRGRFNYEGKAYGPFQPSKATPYTEVPETLARALKLPEYEGKAVPKTTTQSRVPDLPEPHEQAETLNQVAEAKTEVASTETPLPDDFPMRSALIAGGFDTLEAVRAATDEQLEAVDGIGVKSVERIREALK